MSTVLFIRTLAHTRVFSPQQVYQYSRKRWLQKWAISGKIILLYRKVSPKCWRKSTRIRVSQIFFDYFSIWIYDMGTKTYFFLFARSCMHKIFKTTITKYLAAWLQKLYINILLSDYKSYINILLPDYKSYINILLPDYKSCINILLPDYKSYINTVQCTVSRGRFGEWVHYKNQSQLITDINIY